MWKQKSEGVKDKSIALEWNAAKPWDLEWIVPKGCIVEAQVNGSIARALIDTGLFSDFILTMLVDQLKLEMEQLKKPLTLQLTVTGLCGTIHSSITVDFNILASQQWTQFNVINLDNYDMILGTPFLYQHKVMIGFNPMRFLLGSLTLLPIAGNQVVKIKLMAVDVFGESLENVRELLRKEAEDLDKAVEDTPLPPFCEINHHIPLKDESFKLPFLPSWCPIAFCLQWKTKQDIYLRTGWWQYKTGLSTVQMLFVKKKPGPNGELRMKTVFAKQVLNKNTIEIILTSAWPGKYH
jgi:hypothetical protein